MIIHTITDEVFRCDQPKTDEDFALIKQNFFEVIDFESSAEGRVEVTKLAPVPVASFPISTWQIIVSGISQEYLALIQREIDLSPKPVVLHCREDRDRSGLIAAVYRVRKCNWPPDEAWAEAKQLGYRGWDFGLDRTWKKWLKKR